MWVAIPVRRRRKETNMAFCQWWVLPKPLLLTKLLHHSPTHTALAGVTDRTFGTWNLCCFVWNVRFRIEQLSVTHTHTHTQKKGFLRAGFTVSFCLLFLQKMCFCFLMFLIHLVLSLQVLVSHMYCFLSQKRWVEISLYKEYCHWQMAQCRNPDVHVLCTCNHGNLKSHMSTTFDANVGSLTSFLLIHHSL
jgi:hypothetical protein